MLCKIATFTEKHEVNLVINPPSCRYHREKRCCLVTFDHQGEVAICKCILGHEYPPLVVRAVYTLISSGVHVT